MKRKGKSAEDNYEEARPRENSDTIFCIFISVVHFLVLDIFMAEMKRKGSSLKI